MEANLYDTDFYDWTVKQSEFLHLGKFDNLDLQNLAEEIESLGKQQKQELRNRLAVLIGHILKWQYQSEKKTRSWQVTINLQRQEILELLEDNPSLKSYLEVAVTKAFLSGISLVLLETSLSKKVLPSECPYTTEQLFDANFPEDLDIEF